MKAEFCPACQHRPRNLKQLIDEYQRVMPLAHAYRDAATHLQHELGAATVESRQALGFAALRPDYQGLWMRFEREHLTPTEGAEALLTLRSRGLSLPSFFGTLPPDPLEFQELERALDRLRREAGAPAGINPS
ncbi:MAG TPA: hypothetical protein PKE47_06795 [Verrucomicrobiota bacterium]|nr:hypothetical protein [Verrucomicrobiota bacterium]